jgi:hypothetical protein
MNVNDLYKAAFGQYGSQYLTGDGDIADFTGATASMRIIAISFLEDTQVHDLETFEGGVGSISTVTAENTHNTSFGAANVATDVGQDGSSPTFPKGLTIYGSWDKIELHSGSCIIYLAPRVY